MADDDLPAGDRRGNGDVDLTSVFRQPGGVVFNESDRLRLARQVLLCLAGICIATFVARGADPENKGVAEVFEFIKIGALPLVTLVISFYFPSTASK